MSNIRTRTIKEIEWAVPLGHTGWRKLGFSISCVPDAQYPWPADVIRRIRAEVNPYIVPVAVYKAFRSPNGGDIVLMYHGVAQYNPMPKVQPLRPRSVTRMTTGYGSRFEPPTQMLRVFEDKDVKRGNGLSGGFLPLGPWLYEYCDANFRKNTSWEEDFAFMDKYGKAAEASRNRLHEVAEAEYLDKSEGPYRKRLVESLGVDDYKAVAAHTIHGPAPYEPKVYVHASERKTA